ncbi:unnamed protein product [Mytilus coruscus]|uniref:Integrase catalytic domain-containing protein n=1 Tax=Mytilus coruscus TaxID=42192 RepID=A0A6J8D809_MYTCO|nr:unnamed protein product [Mytilus coruscus]
MDNLVDVTPSGEVQMRRKQEQALPELAQEKKRITQLAHPTAPIDIRYQSAKDCFKRTVNDTEIQSGHLGLIKTVAVSGEYFTVWMSMQIFLSLYSNEHCVLLEKQPPRRANSKTKQYHAGAPMERVALDIIGPFPLSKKGNKYSLIVSDYFTRWAEVYPMPDIETKTIWCSQTSSHRPRETI